MRSGQRWTTATPLHARLMDFCILNRSEFWFHVRESAGSAAAPQPGLSTALIAMPRGARFLARLNRCPSTTSPALGPTSRIGAIRSPPSSNWCIRQSRVRARRPLSQHKVGPPERRSGGTDGALRAATHAGNAPRRNQQLQLSIAISGLREATRLWCAESDSIARLSARRPHLRVGDLVARVVLLGVARLARFMSSATLSSRYHLG